MTQRRRSRNPGAIDSNISSSDAIPPLPSWVSGRFYTSIYYPGALGTTVSDSSCQAIPIIVPNDVTVTSIGLEVTSAGTAGALIRLGIYNSDAANFLPGALLIDAGTVAGDSVAFGSAVISLYLRPGHYWAAAAFYTPTTYPTIRTLTTTLPACFGFSGATPGTITQIYVAGISVSNPGPGYAQNGLPRKFNPLSITSSDTVLIGSTKVPRILLGV